VTPHVTGMNPVFNDGGVYDYIIEEGSKPVVVDPHYTKLTNRQYEPPVLPFGDNRSVPIYPSDNNRPTSVNNNHPATHDNETGMEQYHDNVSPSNVTGIGLYISVGSDTYTEFGEYIHPK